MLSWGEPNDDVVHVERMSAPCAQNVMLLSTFSVGSSITPLECHSIKYSVDTKKLIHIFVICLLFFCVNFS